MQLLVKLFKFLNRRMDSAFAKTVLRRLVSSRTSRPPVSISKLIKNLGKDTSRTAVVVGTVTADMRALECGKMSVAAVRFTETARARITAAGGECLTLDELVMKNPTGKYLCCLSLNGSFARV
jgi:large subunit ribosomal protein L18e